MVVHLNAEELRNRLDDDLEPTELEDLPEPLHRVLEPEVPDDAE